MNNEKTLDLSWETVSKVAIAIIGFYILFNVKDILVWFIFALIISILFKPGIDVLMRLKIPRVIATSLMYLAVFGILSVTLYFIVSVLITEVEQFSRVMPIYFRDLSPTLSDLGIHAFEDIENFIEVTKGSLRELTAAIFSASFAFFGGLAKTFFVMTTAFFISLEGNLIERTIRVIFPKKYEKSALHLWEKSQKQVSGWFLSRIVVCSFVGVATYVSALVAGIKYPLSFGLIAGVFNFILYIGPLVSGAFIFLVTAIDSLPKAIFILIAFIVIQMLDGGLMTPILSKTFIGLSPVLVIIALAVGGTLWGMLGALLAIPLMGITFEFLKEFLKRKKRIEVIDL